MAKLDLKKMSVKDIISNKLVLISVEQLWDIVNDWELLDEYFCQKNFQINDKNISKYIIEHDENINKEKLIYVSLKNLKKYGLNQQKNILERSKGTTNVYHTIYKKYLELLKNSNVEVPVIKEKDGIYEIEKFENIKDLTGEPKDARKEIHLEKHNFQVLLNVQKRVPLETWLLMEPLADFEKFICFYAGNGAIFKNLIIENAKRMTQSEINQALQVGKELSEQEESEAYVYHMVQQTKNIFEKHIEKFNVEKLLLLCAYRAKLSLESSNGNSPMMLDIMRVADENIADPDLKIEGNMYDYEKNKECYTKYTRKNLSEDVARIVGNRYFSKEHLIERKKLFLNGTNDLSQLYAGELFNLYQFTENERRKLIKHHPKNFEYLLRLNVLSPEEIKNELDHIGDFKLEKTVLEASYLNGNLDKTDIIHLYMKNNIDLQDTLYLHEMFDLKPELTMQELMRYYVQMKEDEEKTKDFNRYALLFRELKTKGKTVEEQSDMAEQIMEELYKTDGDYEEDLKKLYEFDLLPIQTLLDWNGEEMAYELMRENSLKQSDAKALLLNGKLDIDKVFHILKISNLSDAEKVNFIFGSFNGRGENDEEKEILTNARNKLMQSLNGHIGYSHEKSQSHGMRGKGNGKTSYHQYIVDPQLRWEFLSSLDEDCDSTQMYSRTTAVFILPNVNGGIAIIEKLFKNTANGTKYNYGDATFAMKLEDFYSNKDKIIQDDKVEKKVLTQMTEEGKAKRFLHVPSWGRSIAEYANVSLENGYSQKKIQEIDELIERIRVERDLIK